MRLFLLLVLQKLPLLGRLNSFRLAVRDGADFPRVCERMRTRLEVSAGDGHACCAAT